MRWLLFLVVFFCFAPAAFAGVPNPARMDVSPARVVSPAEAAQAALVTAARGNGWARSAADTEGSLPGGRQLQARHKSRSLTIEESYSCWTQTLSYGWDSWPYDKHVHDNTTWCAGNYSHLINYRSSYTTLSANWCDPTGPYVFKIDGGAGYQDVLVEAGGYFACPTAIPWITYHYHKWQHDDFSGWGPPGVTLTVSS